MTFAKIISYLKHYAVGLIASCVNAGMSAMKLIGGQATGAILMPTHVPLPTAAALVSLFLAAMWWHAVDYFVAHPLPVLEPIAPAVTKVSLP